MTSEGILGVPLLGVNSIGDYNNIIVDTDGAMSVRISDGANALPVAFSITPDMVEALWARMLDLKPIVPCPHCDSANVITNSNCIQCGAPLGKAITQRAV